MLWAAPITCDRYKYPCVVPPIRLSNVGCLRASPSSTLFSTINPNLFMGTFPQTVAPSLLFISSLVSLILIVFQVSSLYKSQWTVHDTQGTRRLLVLSVTLFVVFFSALSATLGLVAHQAYHMGNRSLAKSAGLSGKIIVIVLQSGRKRPHISSSNTHRLS